MEKPNFITRDGATILAEITADYEARTGKKLQPAQLEALLISSFSARELLLREQINEAACLNLVEFSNGTILEYIASLVGVSRLAASPAGCTLQFVIVSGHTGVTIPALTRVGSTDGKVYFSTVESIIVNAGTFVATVAAECTPAGTVGNGYPVGAINSLLDPLAFISSVSNLDTPTGGAEIESDAALKERIKAAPSAYSSAGSRGAYRFWALSAHPAILDVGVESTTPGQVDVYVLPDSPTIIAAVENQLNAETIRPLTDTVVVQAASAVDYSIEADVTVFDTADEPTVLAAVSQAVGEYVTARANVLGKDVVRAQLIKTILAVDGVYNVDLVAPLTDSVLDSSQYANCTAQVITIIGSAHG